MKKSYLALTVLLALSGFSPLNANAAPTYNVDNTAENVRDRNNNSLTPEDQSNRKCAIKTTAKLRREIIRTKGLSQDAQNIKIIDRAGCVTLRGPVETQQEKTIIENLARQCCGANVNSELEVKAH